MIWRFIIAGQPLEVETSTFGGPVRTPERDAFARALASAIADTRGAQSATQ